MSSKNKPRRTRNKPMAAGKAGKARSPLVPRAQGYAQTVLTIGNETTRQGGPSIQSRHLTAEAQLRRSVLACLLWEKEFYEAGEAIADRVVRLATECEPEAVAALAEEARNEHHLRHVPLLLLCALARTGARKPGLVRSAVVAAIERADEMAELLAVYWRNGRKPLPAQFKKGLALCFDKFDAHQLAKWDRDKDVKLRDVMFLVKPKPKDAERAALYKAIADRTLRQAGTWEADLSAAGGGADGDDGTPRAASSEDKKAVWERMLAGGRLGYLALLRNLRNMHEAGVSKRSVEEAILARKGARRVLPFRYVAAARAAPQYKAAIDRALTAAIDEAPLLKGTTIVLVDVSGSMDSGLSARSDLKRLDAAAALASVINGELRVFSFSNDVVEVPASRGLAGVDAIVASQPRGNTYLGKAVEHVNRLEHDRLIVITDEQSHDRVPPPRVEKAYMINVASAQNGVGYGDWIHLDGFSEQVIRWIIEYERQAP